MLFTRRLRSSILPSRQTQAKPAHRPQSKRRKTWQPLLEQLEARTVPSIITVNTTMDEDDAVMDTLMPPAGPDMKLSLREAINYANDNPGTTIDFNIPTTDLGHNTPSLGAWQWDPSRRCTPVAPRLMGPPSLPSILRPWLVPVARLEWMQSRSHSTRSR